MSAQETGMGVVMDAPADLLDTLSQEREWSEEETYWAITHSVLWNPAFMRDHWCGLFLKADDADAYPAPAGSDGKGAPFQTTVADTLKHARRYGCAGAELRAYLDSEWVVLKRWAVTQDGPS